MIFLKKFLFVSIVVIFLVSFFAVTIELDKKKFNNKIEHFAAEFATTQVSEFTPKEGDSSTIITIRGIGLDYIGNVFFNDVECVIMDVRTDNEIKILPPSLSEIGKTIEEVRKVMRETGNGIKVTNIKLGREGLSNTPENTMTLPGAEFFYIDKGEDWKNACPTLPTDENQEEVEPPTPVEEEEDEEGDEEVIEEQPGTDMYFLNVTLPNLERNLNNILRKIETKINRYSENNPILEDAESLQKLQAMESIKRYQEDLNVQRYNIHKQMSEDYGYSF